MTQEGPPLQSLQCRLCPPVAPRICPRPTTRTYVEPVGGPPAPRSSQARRAIRAGGRAAIDNARTNCPRPLPRRILGLPARDSFLGPLKLQKVRRKACLRRGGLGRAPTPLRPMCTRGKTTASSVIRRRRRRSMALTTHPIHTHLLTFTGACRADRAAGPGRLHGGGWGTRPTTRASMSSSSGGSGSAALSSSLVVVTKEKKVKVSKAVSCAPCRASKLKCEKIFPCPRCVAVCYDRLGGRCGGAPLGRRTAIPI